MDHCSDPLLCEPKRTKKSQDRCPCLASEYAATTAKNLKIHVESNHERVRYPCTKCDYIGNTTNNLKVHVESKHEGVSYLCPNCEYAATKLQQVA